MRWIRIEIPDQLHKALKQQALDENVSLKALITRLLSQAVGHQAEPDDE